MPWEAAVSKARELGVVVRQGKAPGSEAGALQVKAGAWGARKAWAASHLKTAKGLNRFPKVPQQEAAVGLAKSEDLCFRKWQNSKSSNRI